MNPMWSKRSVLIAIVVAGTVGRLAGCATMGSSGKMMFEPPFVIAGSDEGPRATTPQLRATIDTDNRIRSTG